LVQEDNSDNNNNSESGDDDELRERSLSSSSSKKTVRFNEKVQENVFRPNSSILGQRKKNQKKQQRKRKRTNSGDSQTGGSENENDDEHENEQAETEKEEAESDDVIVEKSVEEKGDKPMVGSNPGQKKSQKKPVVLEDKRYNGFVLGENKRPQLHRRHSSGDSALGDDEEEAEVFSKPIPKGKKGKRRTVSCGDTKGSVDE